MSPAPVQVEALEALPYSGARELNAGRERFAAGERFAMREEHAPRWIAQGRVISDDGYRLGGRRLGPPAVFPRREREAWILATGPSLAAALERVPADAVVFGVNDAQPGKLPAGVPLTYWVTADPCVAAHSVPLGVPLTYWVTADPCVAAHSVPLGAPELRRFVCEGHRHLVPAGVEVTGYRTLAAHGGYGLSLDWDRGAYAAAGSAYVALQLALMSGALDVHILGLDLGWPAGEASHFWGEKHTHAGEYAKQVAGWRRAFALMREGGIAWTNHSPASRELLEV